MELKERVGFRGEYSIEIIDVVTGKSEILNLNNTLTSINKNIHLAMLLGVTDGFSMNDLDIKYFGFGTDATEATPAQSQLGNEMFRKQLTQKSRPAGANYVESIVSIGSSEANFNIKEIGVFAGVSATQEFNTGNMISRIVVDIDKFENKIINVIRRDVVTI